MDNGNLIEKSAELLRHELGSIDLSDIEELDKVELTDEEMIARAGDASGFYHAHFDRSLRLFIQKQLEYIGTQANGTDQLLFGRGTVNGLLLIQDWFETREAELAQKREEEKPVKVEFGHI